MSTTPPAGYIKIHRRAMDAEHGSLFWREPRVFSRWEAWEHTLMMARFAAGSYPTKYGPIHLERGEVVMSLRWMAERWEWSVKRARGWLATVTKEGMLRAQRETAAGTVYLVVNYDLYQGSGHSEGTDEGTAEGIDGAQQGHSEGTRKKKVKKEKQETTTSPDVLAVLEHYRTTHPLRRPGEKEAGIIARALKAYTVAELCEAITGNATDPWHREAKKHELSYVLRDNDHIDAARAKAQSARPASTDAPRMLKAHEMILGEDWRKAS